MSAVDTIPGVHHVTAIATDPQRNVDFYAGVLGLRLVKRTVNFDDPYTYHLYYGDETGRPGSLLTFFPWPRGAIGRRGAGQVTAPSFLIPPDSTAFWLDRLAAEGVRHERPTARFDEEVIGLTDPDGVRLELVAHPAAEDVEPWAGGPVPPEHAVRGLRGVTLSVHGYERTATVLTETMGFEAAGEARGRFRFRASDEARGSVVDVQPTPNAPGRVGTGTVHHVAFRLPDGSDQAAWRETLVERGLNPTPVIDRNYFRSVYFREPGGVLFELATDGPGFTVDEGVDDLGSALQLPEWLETDRRAIERQLPRLYLPTRRTDPGRRRRAGRYRMRS